MLDRLLTVLSRQASRKQDFCTARIAGSCQYFLLVAASAELNSGWPFALLEYPQWHAIRWPHRGRKDELATGNRFVTRLVTAKKKLPAISADSPVS